MNAKPSILIVDSNEAFATMLQESLEQSGAYRATATANGDEALRALSAEEFDLAIVDLGLTSPDGATVVRTLRQQRPGLRLVVIPLEGDEVPPELAGLEVQAALPKPFFLPHLPRRINDALGLPVAEAPDITEAAELDRVPAGPAVTGAAPSGVLRDLIPQVTEEMARLSREIEAQAVILTRGERVVASTGRLADEEIDALAEVVAESWHRSGRVARILGTERLRFEQSVEGGEYVFYSLAVAEDMILSAALRPGVPLGIIRHQAKATAGVLRDLIGTSE